MEEQLTMKIEELKQNYEVQLAKSMREKEVLYVGKMEEQRKNFDVQLEKELKDKSASY
jgi:hypothetical protein